MRQSFLYALRRLKRGWSSGELLILLLALVVAVASSSAVSLFSSRVQAAIAAQTGDTLGADLMFSARDPLSADLTEAARATGAKLTTVVQFPSVVFQGETSALASIKAVEAGYPLRGRLLIAPEPFAAASLATALPAPGEAWMDARLWQELRLTREARIKAGASEFRVTAVLVEEPGRGAGFSDLAPRLLLNAADLAAAELLGEGSRAQYALQATGSPEQLAALQALERPQGVRLISPQDARPELQAALRNAGEFLGLARVAAALLAAAAIALCAWQYGQKARDEVALLKTLGASGDFISNALTLQLLLLGALGGSIGALLGLAAQEVIAQLLGGLMQISLPPAPLTGLLPAVALALLLLLAFAAPPLLRARHTPPLRVFQRDETALRVSPLLWLSAIGGALGLLWMQTSTLKSAAFVLGGAVAASAVLALLGALLVRVLTPLRTRGGTAWRFGLGNLARRRGATIGQAVALGLALLALLLVTVVRQDLLSTWQGRLKPDTPNQFLINIQSDQLEALRAFFARYQLPSPTLWPMARARLTALRGVEVTPDSFPDPETQRWINREFNLSWTDTLGEDNRIIEGTWWGPEGRGQSLISADDYAIKRLGLKLGDTLTLDFAGDTRTFAVSSFREVSWDSFKPNFFLLTPTGVLDDVPAQYLTSFHLTPEQRPLLRALVDEFPNITALDIESVMNQVRGIMDRIVRAVEFLFLFTLAAGGLVLLAAMEATRGERLREAALLRTLGASSRTIRNGLLAEYAVLGALAGLTAAIVAQAAAWVLAEQVFRIPYGPRPLFWLAGGGAGCGLVMALGWLSLRAVLRTPPKTVLQAAV